MQKELDRLASEALFLKNVLSEAGITVPGSMSINDSGSKEPINGAADRLHEIKQENVTPEAPSADTTSAEPKAEPTVTTTAVLEKPKPVLAKGKRNLALKHKGEESPPADKEESSDNNPWASLAKSTLQRKTVKDLRAYLSERVSLFLSLSSRFRKNMPPNLFCCAGS